MAEATVYHCTNPACPLGTPGQPGRFTAGITAEALHLLTGKPLEGIEESGEFGEGYCPNCGQEGQEFDPSEEE